MIGSGPAPELAQAKVLAEKAAEAARRAALPPAPEPPPEAPKPEVVEAPAPPPADQLSDKVAQLEMLPDGDLVKLAGFLPGRAPTERLTLVHALAAAGVTPAHLGQTPPAAPSQPATPAPAAKPGPPAAPAPPKPAAPSPISTPKPAPPSPAVPPVPPAPANSLTELSDEQIKQLAVLARDKGVPGIDLRASRDKLLLALTAAGVTAAELQKE